MAIMQIFIEKCRGKVEWKHFSTLQFPSRSDTFAFIVFDSQLNFLSFHTLSVGIAHKKLTLELIHTSVIEEVNIVSISSSLFSSSPVVWTMIHSECWTLNDAYCLRDGGKRVKI